MSLIRKANARFSWVKSKAQVQAKLTEHGLTIHSQDDAIKEAFKHTASPIICWRTVCRMRKESK